MQSCDCCSVSQQISRERPYGSRQSGVSPGPLSPQLMRSVPSSPSRFSYNTRSMPGGATLPRGHGSASSSILERRDVRPDEVPEPYVFPETRLSMSDAPDGFLTHTLYRQRSRKYSDAPLSPRTPPPSPHRAGEMVERTPSLRRTSKRENNGTMGRGNMVAPGYELQGLPTQAELQR